MAEISVPKHMMIAYACNVDPFDNTYLILNVIGLPEYFRPNETDRNGLPFNLFPVN